jgi:hypothetical protein
LHHWITTTTAAAATTTTTGIRLDKEGKYQLMNIQLSMDKGVVNTTNRQAFSDK